jgi:hypothetical protein
VVGCGLSAPRRHRKAQGIRGQTCNPKDEADKHSELKISKNREAIAVRRKNNRVTPTPKLIDAVNAAGPKGKNTTRMNRVGVDSKSPKRDAQNLKTMADPFQPEGLADRPDPAMHKPDAAKGEVW